MPQGNLFAVASTTVIMLLRPDGLTQFTTVFAITRIISPIAAGIIGDLTGDIDGSIVAAADALLPGAVFAWKQKPLNDE